MHGSKRQNPAIRLSDCHVMQPRLDASGCTRIWRGSMRYSRLEPAYAELLVINNSSIELDQCGKCMVIYSRQ